MTVSAVNNQVNTSIYDNKPSKTRQTKADDGIFASFARKNGMDGFADFLRDDWSANMARKAGWDKFADWIDNKEALENPEKANDESFISKGLRAMVKHPVLTIASIATIVFGGVKLYKHLNKTPKAISNPAPVVEETIQATQSPKPTVIKPKPQLEQTQENIEMLTQKVNKGLLYEKEIDFSNIEILKDLPEADKRRIINYLDSHYEDAKNFLTFATGETPATLQCVNSNYDNVYKALRGDSIGVGCLFWDKGGELVYNKKAVRKVIEDNLDFFKKRLGLAIEATTSDVEKELFCCFYSSPLRNNKKYADLMELLIGNDIYDSCHSQIVQDIKKVKLRFYPGCASTLEEYKELLKNSVLSGNSSYHDMPQSFIDDLIKKIDAIPQEAFRSRIDEPIEFMREPQSELFEFRRLTRLAEKLEASQNRGTSLKIS